MAGIHCLTLDIFYYYLNEALGDTEAEVEKFTVYWQGWQDEYGIESNQIEILEQDFQGTLWHNEQGLKDSSCFFFDCSIVDAPNTAKVPTLPKSIRRLQSKLKLPPKTSISLGYTQMIYGWVDDYDDSLIQELYEHLVGEPWQHKREGKLLGAKIVEAWKSHYAWDVPEPGSHVLIVLYPDEETYKKASSPRKEPSTGKEISLTFDGWLPLLLYRHKIWYSYQNSRTNKEKARNTFNKAIQSLNYNTYNLTELLTALKKNLDNLTDYSTDLNTINIHQHSLDTNLDNYSLALKQLTDIANYDCKMNHFRYNNLNFLKEFTNVAETKYQKQLARDYTTLAPGLAVLTGLTETIRGLVEVQQAEIDRQLNNTVAIAGIGLAASSAFAGIAATQVYQPDNKKSEQIFWLEGNYRPDWLQGLGFSLIPVAITLVIWLCMKKKR